jgi:hypothetical protein
MADDPWERLAETASAEVVGSAVMSALQRSLERSRVGIEAVPLFPHAPVPKCFAELRIQSWAQFEAKARSIGIELVDGNLEIVRWQPSGGGFEAHGSERTGLALDEVAELGRLLRSALGLLDC